MSSIGKKCKICNSDNWEVIDNPTEYVEFCITCWDTNKVTTENIYNKQDFVSKFECPDCGGLSGTLEENDFKLGVRCSNCKKLVIMIEKHPSMINNRHLASKSKPAPIETNKPKCPTCRSTNIEKISFGKKAIGGAMFGLFSSDIRNTMHCKNCGAKW